MQRVYILFIFIAFASSDVVKWLPDKSFSLATNFRDHKRPCSKQTVIFPQTMYESTTIDSDISVSGMVLPKDGSLTIDATIKFGRDPNDNCTEEGNTYFMPSSTASWAQVDVWSSPRFNKATPDFERVPCFDDIAEFATNAEFTLKLPDLTQRIQGIKYGSIIYKTDSFLHYLTIDSSALHILHDNQAFILNKFGETGVILETKQCKSRAGCPCQEQLQEMDCSLKFCPVPKCVNPIQPTGHCCKICGGYLTINVDQTFEMMAFKEKVEKIVESYGKNYLYYHIGRIPGNKVQLIMVDKDEYVGNSALVVHEVAVVIGNSYLEAKAVYSGSPLSLSGMEGKISFSMFFLVILIMGAIFVYYYKMPEMRFPFTMYAGGRRAVISRFNRRTDSVVSLTSRRDSESPIGTSAGTAFRNPLYDSKRGRVQVDETLIEE
ncbi:protein amnionless [Hyposmocoma kahamanoa]|uniref:protein amnionless n=1 Tax=Hyposmocoma kahamanoa TaxID=1477025 RepID=UPI000E6D896B|nr:protein amnionless [Hyposmocoma kahamanoa]